MLGLRIFEATSADIADLGEKHGHRILWMCGKGTKIVLVPLPPAVGRGHRPGKLEFWVKQVKRYTSTIRRVLSRSQPDPPSLRRAARAQVTMACALSTWAQMAYLLVLSSLDESAAYPPQREPEPGVLRPVQASSAAVTAPRRVGQALCVYVKRLCSNCRCAVSTLAESGAA
jgi:hypothetical protein